VRGEVEAHGCRALGGGDCGVDEQWHGVDANGLFRRGRGDESVALLDAKPVKAQVRNRERQFGFGCDGSVHASRGVGSACHDARRIELQPCAVKNDGLVQRKRSTTESWDEDEECRFAVRRTSLGIVLDATYIAPSALEHKREIEHGLSGANSPASPQFLHSDGGEYAISISRLLICWRGRSKPRVCLLEDAAKVAARVPEPLDLAVWIQ